MLKIIAPLAFCLTLLASLPAAAGMMLHDARIMLGIGDRPAVMHGEIVNHGQADTKLIGVESPDFARIELHTHEKTANGMMRMRQVPHYDLPQHGRVKLAPRGDHLMLFGFTGAPGDTVSLRFHFADGTKLDAQIETKARKKHAGHKNPAMHHGH